MFFNWAESPEEKSNAPSEVSLNAGVQLDIPAETEFLFESSENKLTMIVATMHCWTTIPQQQRSVTVESSILQTCTIEKQNRLNL